MSELIHVPFHGEEILTVAVDGKPHIVLRPAIERLGLDYRTQQRKLESKSWATVGMVPTVAADGRTRQMTTVDVRTFLMLLATVDERRVSDEVRPILVAYQSEVADVIAAYWTGSHATDKDPFAPVTWTWDEARVVIRQRYGVNAPVIHLRRTLRTAGVLRQTGEPKTRYEHWFWFTGTAWEILPHYVPALLRKYEDTIRALRGHQQGRLNLAGDELPFDGGDVIELRQGGA